MVNYIGWILAAFLGGSLLTQWLLRTGDSLPRRVARLGTFRGRSYAEILERLRSPQEVNPRADGSVVRTWRSADYSISLLFDAQDICLGVQSEGE